jgi:hypothetical protein
LQRLSGRERRFQAAEDHAISKCMIQDALELRASICFEDLAHIRDRAKVSKAERRAHHGWSFSNFEPSPTTSPDELEFPLSWRLHGTRRSLARCTDVSARARGSTSPATVSRGPADTRRMPTGTQPVICANWGCP